MRRQLRLKEPRRILVLSVRLTSPSAEPRATPMRKMSVTEDKLGAMVWGETPARWNAAAAMAKFSLLGMDKPW